MGSRAAQLFLPGALIQAVAYQGTNVLPAGEAAYQRDAHDITGPLDRQILDACSFVRKNMRVAAYKHEDGGRHDLPQFEMLAVFEAVTNAVAHRDYSMAGSKVRLRLFDDRLELYSPGMLPNTMTPVLVAATLNLGLAILSEATLSFLGVGMPITQPSLGTLIRIGNQYLFSGSWWLVVFPAAQLGLIVLSVNLLGDWLRDALNPKLH
jgi:hypothetical protein